MSSARAFNTSTKDSRSVKLRNPRLSSKESDRLETDNYKMEARLRELKLSMKRQKQERENMHSDGAIWSSGKPGAVTSHGTDLLKKEPSKPTQSKGKARKIKVLKDTPLDIPKRAPVVAPFTERSPPKLKGPACGQCEQKAVALTCMECGENYCTTCFAKFHMKGALKNHRSVPYQKSGSSSTSGSLDLSNGMTPSPKSSVESLPMRPPSANRRTTTSIDSSGEPVKTIAVKLKGPEEMTGGAFLQGTFSEEESSLSFAQALAEWRAAKQSDSNDKPQEEKKVESITSGTSTEEPEPIEITFKKDTSITYADKLLIKKHRRTELSPLPSPRLSSYEDKENYSPRRDVEPLTNGHAEAISDEETEIQEEHERYIGIFNEDREPDQPRLESALSIVEVTEVPSPDSLEVESVYNVEEIDDPNTPISEHTASNGIPVTAPSKLQDVEASPLTGPGQSSVTPTPSRPDARVSSSQKGQQPRPESTKRPSRTASTPSGGNRDSKTPTNKKNQQAVPKQEERFASARPSRLRSSQEERKPISHQKPKSAGVATQQRSSTRSAEKPKRTTSSSKEGAASGRSSGLTSNPSGELVAASHLGKQSLHQYKAGLGDFFLAGLEGEGGDPEKEDVDDHTQGSTTPVNRLPKCSYQGGLPAWRPDSSLAASPALQESLKAFSPSPPPKSGRQSHRGSAAKTRQVKPTASVDPDPSPPNVKVQGPSAKVRDDRWKGSPRPDTANTISWMLSEQGEKKRSWNDNNNGTSGDDKQRKGKVTSGETLEPDRCSSRIDVDGDDMTMYDSTGQEESEEADQEMLEKLTWELASQSGRITADGRLTSMSLPDPDDEIYRENSFSQDRELGIENDNGMGSGLSTPFDFVTGKSISPMESDEEDRQADVEVQRYTAEVEALH